MARMTGHAPLNAVYVFAARHFSSGSITRCKYATLALMARQNGDLLFADIPKRKVARMVTLEAWGLVRKVRSLKRYELTAEGWQLLVRSDALKRLLRLASRFDYDSD